jgi:iron complex transport system ATP-binding protein
MIEISNVTVTIGANNLLDDVSAICAAGSLTALVGPNGAGKSTLLSVIAGDRPSQKGTIRLLGKEVGRHSVRELAQIRSVFPQGSVIRFGYRVEEVVAMGRAFRDLPPDGDDEAVLDAMISSEIEHMAFRNAQTLSGGEQARTTFARVAVQATPIVLLDEPAAALDLRHQERVLKEAKAMAQAGATVVAVLHDLNLAAAYADKVVLLQDGRVAADGSPWDVLTQDLIERVYRQDVRILEHPVRGCPVVLTT